MLHQAVMLCRADAVSDLDEAAEKAEGETEGDAAAAAEQEASFFVRLAGEGSTAYAERIFNRVFCFDIERVIKMKVTRTTHTSRWRQRHACCCWDDAAKNCMQTS